VDDVFVSVAVMTMSSVGQRLFECGDLESAIAAWSAQIGSISVMMTRAPWRAAIRRSLTDVAVTTHDRDLAANQCVGGALIPSMSECRQPYLLSNLDL